MQVEGVCRSREDVRSSVQATATREVHPLQRNGTADRGGRSMLKVGGGGGVHTYYNKTSEQGHFGDNINSAVMSFAWRFILKL